MQLAPFAAHAREVRGTDFQGSPSNERRDTAEKGTLFPSKVPLITDRSIQNFDCFQRMRAKSGYEFSGKSLQ
jgi:hypothetical protein